jgi:hypothetical protein
MKGFCLKLVLLLSLCPPLLATNPNLTSVWQPVNLVGQSRRGCIPLAPAICYANYGYGIHKMISAPHPFLGGAREWDKGTESNANLASVFGILVKPIDGTMVPYEPVEILIKDWDIPPYSPHTKAEVLAATIHCLVQSCHATSDSPLDLRIITENDKDQEWAGPFAKKYIRLPGKDKKPVIPTPVGDTVLKTDGFGVRHVISPKLNPNHELPKAPPVILPLEYNHDGQPAHLIPGWTANRFPDPFRALTIPRGHFYNLFTSGHQFSHEANPLLRDQNTLSIRSSIKGDRLELRFSFNGQGLRQINTAIASAAIIARLHHDKPMRITLTIEEPDSDLMETILKTPGWEKANVGNRPAASSDFDYDSKTRSLAKGTLPGGQTIASFPNGPLYLTHPTK